MQRGIAARRVQQLRVHAAGVMLSAAAVSAWVCKGRYGRGRKNQAQQDDNARQSFYAPCGLHHTSVPWSQAEMWTVGQNQRGRLSP
ncbi:hypothetical protein HYPGJ_31789 [Hyphomicrobium sp. GJ21]|nr:hypothetical protein HYPGJ_31789 [Hyphomicrobium sp. GJ21]